MVRWLKEVKATCQEHFPFIEDAFEALRDLLPERPQPQPSRDPVGYIAAGLASFSEESLGRNLNQGDLEDILNLVRIWAGE